MEQTYCILLMSLHCAEIISARQFTANGRFVIHSANKDDFTRRGRLGSVCISYSQQHSQTGLNWINGGNTHLSWSSGIKKFITVLTYVLGIFSTLPLFYFTTFLKQIVTLILIKFSQQPHLLTAFRVIIATICQNILHWSRLVTITIVRNKRIMYTLTLWNSMESSSN